MLKKKKEKSKKKKKKQKNIFLDKKQKSAIHSVGKFYFDEVNKENERKKGNRIRNTKFLNIKCKTNRGKRMDEFLKKNIILVK